LLTRALARQPQHAYILANPCTGKPYTANHIFLRWRQAARACVRVDFHFHDLRHHGPTVAVNRGATVPVLMALGGRKSAARVQRYAFPERDGAFAHERDGHRMGAHAVARDTAGGVGVLTRPSGMPFAR
jgi:hypothetical protein